MYRAKMLKSRKNDVFYGFEQDNKEIRAHLGRKLAKTAVSFQNSAHQLICQDFIIF